MNYFEVMVLTIFDLSMYMLLFHKLLSLDFNKNSKTIAVIVSGSILVGLSAYLDNSVVITQVSNIIIAIVLLRLYTWHHIKKWTLFLISYVGVTVIIYSVQFLIILLVQLTLGEVEFNIMYGLLSQTLGLVLIYLIHKYVPLNIFLQVLQSKITMVRVILINMGILFLGLSFYWNANFEATMDSIVTIAILSLVSMTINVLLIRGGFVDKQHKEKLVILETYIPIIEQLVEEVKIVQHDYNNHMQALKSIAEPDSQLEKYLNDQHMDQNISQLILIENKVLMGLLYSKFKICKEKKIKIDFEILSPWIDSKYTDYELIDIYGILIQNAIEAVSDIQDKIISISINHKDGINILKVKNKVDSNQKIDIHKMFEYQNSSKEDHKGIGLYKLNQILKKYNDRLHVYHDNDHHTLEMSISYH